MTKPTPHTGGPCPVPGDARVTVYLASGKEISGVAGKLRWEHIWNGQGGDIIAYELLPSPAASTGDVRALIHKHMQHTKECQLGAEDFAGQCTCSFDDACRALETLSTRASSAVRDGALEEAADIADRTALDTKAYGSTAGWAARGTADQIAEAIRALKSTPPAHGETREEKEHRDFLAEIDVNTKADEIGKEARLVVDGFLSRDIEQISVRRRVASIMAAFARSKLPSHTAPAPDSTEAALRARKEGV